jgi:PAS domain S-box-containing protein
VVNDGEKRQALLRSLERAIDGRPSFPCTVLMRTRTEELQQSYPFRIKPSAQRDANGTIVGAVCFVELKSNLRALVDSANAAIVGIDLDGRVMEWNEATVEITSYTEEEAIRKPFVDTFIDEASRESVREVLDSALKGQGTTNYQMDIQTRYGEHRHLLVNASALLNARNKIIGAVIVAQNVTEATMHARAVAAMADELRLLVASSNAAVFGVDRDGDVNEWNDKTVQITGFAKDEAFDKNFVYKFVQPSFRKSVKEVLEDAFNGKATSNFELEFKAKGGDIRYLLVNVSPRRDLFNNIVGIIGVAQDITEATKHERQVEAMARELRQLVQTANAPIFGISTDGKVNEWNDKMAEITGFSREQALGHPLVERFIVPQLRQSVQNVLDSALDGRGTSNYELEFRTQSNDLRVLLLNATTRRDTLGNIVGVVGVAQDITEAVQRDRAVAGMANELRQLIDSANAPIFGIDCDWNVNEWNNKTAEITGFSKEDAFDEPLVSKFIAESHRQRVKEVLDQALRGEETSNYEVEFLTKSGEETRFLLVNATTRRDPENNVVGGKFSSLPRY